MLKVRRTCKRLERLLAHARLCRKAGQFERAIHFYTKAMHNCGRDEEQRTCCLYLMAFTYVLINHQNTQMQSLGADLRPQYHSALEQAYKCLKLVDIRHFNPSDYGLPCLSDYEMNEVFNAQREATAIH